MSSVTGHTALVTGAASGIGLACARALADAGAKVHLVDLDPGVRDIASEVGGVGHVLDLTSSVSALPAEVDVLVNNAGVQHVAPIHEFPAERFSAMVELMLGAAFRLTRHVLPHMYSRGWGRLVHISSVHGLRASAFKSAYVAAKHGLEGFSKVAALEGAPHGVTSNCVAPGYVRTPLVEKQIADQARVHGISEADVSGQIFLQRTAVKRLIEPSEVADAVMWLCDNSFVTGTSLAVDGGWTAQ
ncbi:3-hydroxybutyrate dehydrogenase [Lentzea atacamensis]|uniref:3-hydroxybutyrate dehydrogenase n=1 Tax=Lentzea atacamensis TaxID=531938 RepID=A0A316HX19_9PSEU|nr:3-hydroxybutyrate dehydrogenase [Lentzea atacamensis]PWK84681.1 3-hydroxybutyrate dehydrogenase [Lentzea atacamensis]RAS59154.1 3-hydroxybutyrate dehydrogenase [Lentzea atacamensis]